MHAMNKADGTPRHAGGAKVGALIHFSPQPTASIVAEFLDCEAGIVRWFLDSYL